MNQNFPIGQKCQFRFDDNDSEVILFECEIIYNNGVLAVAEMADDDIYTEYHLNYGEVCELIPDFSNPNHIQNSATRYAIVDTQTGAFAFSVDYETGVISDLRF